MLLLAVLDAFIAISEDLNFNFPGRTLPEIVFHQGVCWKLAVVEWQLYWGFDSLNHPNYLIFA